MRERKKKRACCWLLGECIVEDEKKKNKMFLSLSLSLSLLRKTHLRMNATEPFFRASRALSDAFLAATIWATLRPVWARACAVF